jgi:hypothetical protein
MIDSEGDNSAFAAPTTKIDELEVVKAAGSRPKSKSKNSSPRNRFLQKINAVTKAQPESDASISYIKTVSTNDLKSFSGVQNIVNNPNHFHLPGHGGLPIQSLLSYKDYSNASSITHSSNITQAKGLFAKLWLWWASWWSPQAKNSTAH